MSADPITWQTTHGDTVEVYRADRVGHYGCPDSCPDVFFRYRVRAANNKVVEAGSEGYTRRRAAVKAAKRHHPKVEEDWAALQADLDELERTDPDVAAAARSYDDMVQRITGRRIP